MVKLYGFDDCPYCQELKGLYDTNNIDYTYVDVMAEENEKEGTTKTKTWIFFSRAVK